MLFGQWACLCSTGCKYLLSVFFFIHYFLVFCMYVCKYVKGLHCKHFKKLFCGFQNVKTKNALSYVCTYVCLVLKICDWFTYCNFF